MVLKSDIPAEFIVAFFIPENSTEPIKGKELHETDNDIYNITQVDEYTFRITVKSFIEPSRICFAFESKENPAARSAFALITCGFELSDEEKERMELGL